MRISETLTVLRSCLISMLPQGTEVIQAVDNRVPEPAGDDFVLMTMLLRSRLATNEVIYSDGHALGAAGERKVQQSTQVTVQLDVHGPASSENAQIISTLFRDEYAAEWFRSAGYELAPLYVGDPRLMPFWNAEQQMERRWVMDVVLQAKPVVTTGQEFATSLSIQPVGALIETDTQFPPG